MIPRLLNELDQFLFWWSEGLALAIPKRWRGRTKHADRSIVIHSTGTEYLFEHHRGDSVVSTLRLVSNNEGDGEADTVYRWLKGVPRLTEIPVVFRLANDIALVKRVRYPLAARSDLSSVIALDLERQTPFRADDIYFSYEIVGDSATQKILDVDLIVVPKVEFESHRIALEQLGVHPTVVDIENRTFSKSRVNLLPSVSTIPRHQAIVRTRFALLLLWLALLTLIPLKQLSDTRASITALKSIEKAARIDTKELETLREKSDDLTAKLNFYRDLESNHIPVIELLGEVSALLTDDTWLRRFELKNGRLTLQGESDKASEIPAKLERSQFFSAPEFSSPVTRSNSSGKDRFKLLVTVGAAESR